MFLRPTDQRTNKPKNNANLLIFNYITKLYPQKSDQQKNSFVGHVINDQQNRFDQQRPTKKREKQQ